MPSSSIKSLDESSHACDWVKVERLCCVTCSKSLLSAKCVDIYRFFRLPRSSFTSEECVLSLSFFFYLYFMWIVYLHIMCISFQKISDFFVFRHDVFIVCIHPERTSVICLSYLSNLVAVKTTGCTQNLLVVR